MVDCQDHVFSVQIELKDTVDRLTHESEFTKRSLEELLLEVSPHRGITMISPACNRCVA
jgi:hypothetical protein